MKNKMVGILVITLLITTASPAIGNIGKSVHSKEIKELIVFSDLFIKDVPEEEQYVSVNLEEATSFLMKPGEPILPIFTKVFTFPFGTKIKEITCKPSGIQEKIVPKEIIPCPEPVSDASAETAIPKTVKNHEVYSSTNLYPDSWYSYRTGCGLYDDEHVVFLTIGVYPVRYSPERNVLQYIDRVEITVVYEEPFQPLLTNDECDMIIIAPSEFSDELQPLVDYKNPFTDTKLCTLDDVYSGTYFETVIGRDDQEKIKNFIYQAIEQWGITFVLLVGGRDEFPVRLTYTQDNSEEECCVSDLYYADIYNSNGDFCSWDSSGNGKYGEYPYPDDEVDLYPDIYLGRLACTKESEVITVVNKIINYEGAYYEDWFNNLIVCGGDTLDNDEVIDEGEYTTQVIIDIMQGFTSEKIWASNGGLDFHVNINDAITNGAGFVSFCGHGTSFTWSTHPHGDMDTWLPPGGYTTSKIGYLSNANMLPIVIVSACHINDFKANTNCWGWKFISNSNGGGIAQIGPTGVHWIYSGTSTIEGLGGFLHLNFYQVYTEDNAETFGKMWLGGINRYLNFLPYTLKEYDYKDIEQIQPFGDPSLLIAAPSQRPDKPVIDGPTNGKVGEEYTYTSSSTDPDGDQIYYMFDWGDGNFSEWVGPINSGETASTTHIWITGGIYKIKVKAKDIHGAASIWSDPYGVIIPRNKNLIDSKLAANIPQNRFLCSIFDLLKIVFPQFFSYIICGR